MYIAFSAFILVPICWLRDFKNLSYVSMACNVFLLFALCVIIIYSVENMEEQP